MSLDCALPVTRSRPVPSSSPPFASPHCMHNAIIANQLRKSRILHARSMPLPAALDARHRLPARRVRDGGRGPPRQNRPNLNVGARAGGRGGTPAMPDTWARLLALGPQCPGTVAAAVEGHHGGRPGRIRVSARWAGGRGGDAAVRVRGRACLLWACAGRHRRAASETRSPLPPPGAAKRAARTGSPGTRGSKAGI